jgi:hypothetical protein
MTLSASCVSRIMLRDFIALGERAGAPGHLARKLHACLADVFKILNTPDRDPADLAALATRASRSKHCCSRALVAATRRLRGSAPGFWSAMRRSGHSPGSPVCRPRTTPRSERSGMR